MSQVTEPAGLLLPAQLQSPIRPPPLLHKIYQRPALQWTPRADVKARSLRPALTVQRDWTGQEPLPSSATCCGGGELGLNLNPNPGVTDGYPEPGFPPLIFTTETSEEAEAAGCWLGGGERGPEDRADACA